MNGITLITNGNKEITSLTRNIITKKYKKAKKHEEIISGTMVVDEETEENVGGRSKKHVNVLKHTEHINTDNAIAQKSIRGLGVGLLISSLLIP